MQQGTGYILLTERAFSVGVIHVCGGDRLVGDDVAFAFGGCSSQLRGLLEGQGDIAELRNCPPPAGSLRVRFNFDIDEGDDIAVNIRQ